MFIDVRQIYTVEPGTGTADIRFEHDIHLIDSDLSRVAASRLPVRVNGLHRLDFVVFASMIDHDGSSEHPLLVTSTQGNEFGQGKLVDADLAASYPEEFISREFAKKALTLSIPELQQFCMPAPITDYIKSRFPGMSGISR